MRSFSAKQEDASVREVLGLPVLTCPNCGETEAHWVPESLHRPGHFLCDARSASGAETPALDCEWGDLT